MDLFQPSLVFSKFSCHKEAYSNMEILKPGENQVFIFNIDKQEDEIRNVQSEVEHKYPLL